MSLNLSLDFLHFKLRTVREGGYVFGEFRIDPERKMLYRGDSEIPLPPKVIETLIVLVENQGEIVSKTELMDKVWPDTVVEESNLSQHLYYLRKTFGNTSEGTPIIETLRRRGYRFNGLATKIGGSAPPERKAAPRFPSQNLSVRRHDNVLTVTDWEAGPSLLASLARPGTEHAASQRGERSLLPYALGGILVIGIVTAAFWLLQGRNAVKTESVGEIETSFLTNGLPVEGVAISPDGNYFAYHEVEAPVGRLWLQQTGQSGRVEIVPGGERWIGAKTFSPDGRFIYFLAREGSDQLSALYRVPTLGGPYVRILQNVSMPVTFSPDGKEIAFVRYYDDGLSAALIVAPADGSNERVVLRSEGKQTLASGSSWSPDGRLIAFAFNEVDDNPGGDIQLSALELSSGRVMAISAERWDTCYRMQWTADGRALVFIGTRDGESNSLRRDQVYLLNYPDGNARKLTNEGNRHEPTSLSITANNDVLVLPMGRSSQIWEMDANGDSRTAVQITRGLFDGRGGIAPLPDGRVGFVARTGESANLWIMNPDGSDQRQLTGDPSFVEEVRASRDGGFFIFSGVRDRQNHVFRVGPDGSGLVQITNGRGDEIDSSVSSDGTWVIYGSHVIEGSQGRSLIWKVPASGGHSEPVSSTVCSSPHFSPDGKLISCATDTNEIALMDFSSGSLVRTLRTPPLTRLNSGARWTPDGKAVAYISLAEGAANLWLHPTTGEKPQRLTDFAGGDIYSFAFSIDGSRIFLAQGQPIRDAMLIRNFQ
jgi:Tol biopolymer transport system component/DNA-binding winged helix-turn-helix (wHTH) protein